MTVDRIKLKGVYARLRGIERAIPDRDAIVSIDIGQDVDDIVKQLAHILGEDMGSFHIPRAAFDRDGGYCRIGPLKSKLLQLVTYLEHVHHVGTEIIEIGSLYNSIRDEELKRRCSDLLSAPGDFDRAINQATQVLEDRIRTKSGQDAKLTGTQLVGAALKASPNESILKVSTDEGEQRGISDICRGMMLAFRNPTHHQITDKFSREDALKVCAFVDNLLRVIDGAIVARPGS